MITVLRLGHRPERDKRITTHVGLVARAFSADQLIIDTQDADLVKTIESVVNRFGGAFRVESGVNWRSVIRNWKGVIAHLTMYGENIDKVLDKIPKVPGSNLLIVVGATKVPREVYELADYNIAIGHQPHSEVAALALFLDRYFQGKELNKEFNGKLKILPTRKGKIVLETDLLDGNQK
ncbi:tRNA (cytidine(56)-2'-O)-methyltransferase [[Eubacterium] cellulosolvens]